MISTADPAEREAFEALRRVVAWRAGPTVAAAMYPGDDRPPTDHERLLAMAQDAYRDRSPNGLINKTARNFRYNLSATDDMRP